MKRTYRVRCNDEVEAQRRRWTFYETIMLAEAGFAEVKVLSKVPSKSSYGQVFSAEIRALKKKRKRTS